MATPAPPPPAAIAPRPPERDNTSTLFSAYESVQTTWAGTHCPSRPKPATPRPPTRRRCKYLESLISWPHLLRELGVYLAACRYPCGSGAILPVQPVPTARPSF